MEDMALQSSMQRRVVYGDWNPDTWTSSQYWEHIPKAIINTVLRAWHTEELLSSPVADTLTRTHTHTHKNSHMHTQTHTHAHINKHHERDNLGAGIQARSVKGFKGLKTEAE